MVRNVLAIVVGAVVWMFGFLALALMLAQLWPGYALHGRQWTQQGVFTFTPSMACCNLVFWAIGAVAAGFAAAKIAQRREAIWMLAGLVGIYLAGLHLIFYWARFPWWYNWGVSLPAIPAVLWGGRIATTRRDIGSRRS